MKCSHPPQNHLWLALIFAGICVCGVAAGPARSATSLRRSAIVRAVQAARPAVVNIHGHKTIATASTGYSNGTAPRKVNGMGTGVFIDERGYIVTNYHVVDGVRQIKVTLSNGQSYVARLVAHDPQTDLAIIRIPIRQRVPLVKIGTSQDLMEGEEVVAVGNAYGYENTVTRGIISALHRTVQVTDSQQYVDLIQTDASINPGNSGGPLLNIDGEMIGINVAVRVGAQGIGFAIPVDQAMEVAARLLSAEQNAGVSHGITSSAPVRGSQGIVARIIQPDSPAALAGIRPGDIITRVNSTTIERSLDLERSVLGIRPGEQVEFEIQREGHVQQLPVRLVAANGPRATAEDDSVYGQAWTAFGMRLEELPAELMPEGQTQFTGGLRVIEVRSGSPAASEGVVAGDVLVGLHEWVTTSSNDLAYVLSSSQVRQIDRVKFYILRGQETLFGHLPVSWRR